MSKTLFILISLLPNLLAAEKTPLPVYRNPVEFIYPALPSCKKFTSGGCCKPSGTITVSYPDSNSEPVETKKAVVKKKSKAVSTKKKTKASKKE